MTAKRSAILAFLLTFALGAYYVGCEHFKSPAIAAGASLPVLPSPRPGTARFITANIVHGTRIPLPPWLVRETVVRANLREIGQVLGGEQPAVVALQETDHGRQADRASYLAEAAKLPFWADDASIHGGILRHGAALLSRFPLQQLTSETLTPGTTHDKGWVAATIDLPGFEGRRVRVVSLHLDPWSSTTREKQIEQLAHDLLQERLPLVVLGDFNCAWQQGRCAQRLSRQLGLTAAPTHSTPTYSFLGIHRNLDWILVSRQLEVVQVRVLEGGYSDHRAVVADIAFRQTPSSEVRASGRG